MRRDVFCLRIASCTLVVCTAGLSQRQTAATHVCNCLPIQTHTSPKWPSVRPSMGLPYRPPPPTTDIGAGKRRGEEDEGIIPLIHYPSSPHTRLLPCMRERCHQRTAHTSVISLFPRVCVQSAIKSTHATETPPVGEGREVNPPLGTDKGLRS